MCLSLYIASDHALPTIPWDEVQRTPFHVQEAVFFPRNPLVRHFSKPLIYQAGSYGGCGCGFEDPAESGQASRRELADYLSAALEQQSSVEVFVCWSGSEHLPPTNRRRGRPADFTKFYRTLLRYGELVVVSHQVDDAPGEQPATPPEQANDTIRPAEQDALVTIWRVGSPHDGETPAAQIPGDLEALIAACGIRAQVRSFAADQFGDEFVAAMQAGSAALPAILTGNNYLPFEDLFQRRGVSVPSVRASGVLKMIDPFVFLITSAPGYAAARRIAATNQGVATESFSWTLDEPSWAEHSDRVPSQADQQVLAELNARAVSAYVRGDLLEIAPLLHQEFLGGRGTSTRCAVGDIRARRTLGNSRLALMLATASFWNDAEVGCVEVLSVWVNVEGRWSLLTITSDPVSIDATRETIPWLASQLTEELLEQPLPAGSLTPTTDLPSSTDDEYGDFQWTPSASPDVVAEVAEFDYGDASRLFVHPHNRVSAGELWCTGDLWTWRIWSICRDGQIALSEAGRFVY